MEKKKKNKSNGIKDAELIMDGRTVAVMLFDYGEELTMDRYEERLVFNINGVLSTILHDEAMMIPLVDFRTQPERVTYVCQPTVEDIENELYYVLDMHNEIASHIDQSDIKTN